MSKLPLRFRLANGPPSFVGRVAEREWLTRAVERGALTAVWGLGGLGKSALVRHVLHTRFAERVPTTLAARVPPGSPVEQLVLAVARVLAEAQSIGSIDWTALTSDRDALIATMIDLAEGTHEGPRETRPTAGWWVVLDDVHHAPAAEMRELLSLLARYARQSRWIAVSRVDLALDLPGQILALQGMPPEQLRELARVCQPDCADPPVAAAGGSPWRLQQLLAGAIGRDDDAGSIFASLSPEARELLLRLATLERELPLEVVGRLGPLPAPNELDELRRRGVLEHGPEGMRLHDAARPTVERGMSAPARRQRRDEIRRALRDTTVSAALLEAVRLSLEVGDVDGTVALLDDQGEGLIAAGCLPALWQLLEPCSADDTSMAPLASWRLRCAVELDDAAACAKTRLPDAATLEDRHRFARACFLQGRYGRASELAAAVCREAGAASNEPGASGDAQASLRRLAFDAGRLCARSHLYREEPQQAADVLVALAPSTFEEEVQRDVDLAACRGLLGGVDDVLALLERHEARLDELPPAAAADVRFRVAAIYVRFGLVHRAARVIDGLPSSADAGKAGGHYVHDSAVRLCIRFCIAHQRGEAARARGVLERLHALTARSPSLSTFARTYGIYVDLRAGALEGLRERMAQEIRHAETVGHGAVRDELMVLWWQLAVELGAAEASPPIATPDGPRNRATDYRVRLGELLHRVHHRREPLELVDPAGFDSGELRAQASVVASRAALLAAGDGREARRQAEAALTAAEASGLGLLETAARTALCEALLVQLAAGDGALEELQTQAHALQQHAAGCEAPTAPAQLMLLLCDREMSLTELFALARDRSSPSTARRAAALSRQAVGGGALDAIDEVVVAAARRAAPWSLDTLLSADGAGWGLDFRHQRVWLPDGRAVDLSRRALLWRLLTTLADLGGAADKETLTCEVWHEREYHPLRHDNRLHAAVRKLRRALGDDGPSYLQTTDSGYALAAPLFKLSLKRP